MKSISHLLGFDFIKNKTLRGIVRVVATAGIAVASTTPLGGAILAAAGVTPSAGAIAIITALGGLEGLRGLVKHKKP